MRLAELVRLERVTARLESQSKEDVLAELAGLLASGGDSSIDSAEFLRVLQARERLRSTGVGSGVAIPHGKVTSLNHLILAVGLSADGVDFDAADGEPVTIFMALAAPVGSTGDHLRALARIARLCNDAEFRRRLLVCKTDEEAYETLVSEDEKQSGP